MIDTILFDLDGTLLPMDQEAFLKLYLGLMADKMAEYGYEPKRLVKSVWAGTEAMVRNNGLTTNEEVFWRSFRQIHGDKAMKDKPVFEEFYAVDFPKVQTSCGCNPAAKEAVQTLKEKGYRLVLATNPLFPAVATRQRIRWAGLKEEDFVLVTTYENSRHCKPNMDYYRDVLAAVGAKPENCMMVGNDVDEDMIAARLGMEVYLVTDCLINKKEKDLRGCRQGSLADFAEFVRREMADQSNLNA